MREKKHNLKLVYCFTALFFFPMRPLFLNEILHYFHGSFYSAEKRAKLYNVQPFSVLRLMKVTSSEFYSGRWLERCTYWQFNEITKMWIKKATTKILRVSKRYQMPSVDEHFCGISEMYLLVRDRSREKPCRNHRPGNVQEDISAQRVVDSLQQPSRDGRSRGRLGNYSHLMH